MADSTVQSIEIDATPEQCFEVAADIASYPEWATGIRQVDILDLDSEGRVARAHFLVDGMVKEIAYTLVYDYQPPGQISWRAEPGDDIRDLEGSYTFSQIDEGKTKVIYALRAEPAFTIPGFLRRQVEKQVVGTALRGLRERVTEITGG